VAARNVDVIRGGYEDFRNGDFAGVMNRFDPEIEWSVTPNIPFGGDYRGHEEVARFFEMLDEHYEELRVEPDEFIADGDRVVVLGVHRGRTRVGNDFEIHFSHSWLLRDGKALGFREYADGVDLRRALGLD
jgi:ketosteroid isomerase-like protein